MSVAGVERLMGVLTGERNSRGVALIRHDALSPSQLTGRNLCRMFEGGHLENAIYEARFGRIPMFGHHDPVVEQRLQEIRTTMIRIPTNVRV